MTLLRVTLALMLVMMAVLLAAGCTGKDPATYQQVHSTTTRGVSPVPTPVTMVPVIPVRTTCPVAENQSSWITISPVDRIERGEAIWINGTTNIPAGKHLDLYVYSGSFHPHCRCCFDDQLAADVIIRGGEGCANTFGLWFDSTFFNPDEYVVTAIDHDNMSESGTLIFTLQQNSTPLPVPAEKLPVAIPAGVLLTTLQPHDIARGGTQTVAGTRNGTPYAIEYSIRDAGIEPVCRPLCAGENFHGIIHPVDSGDGTGRFAIRFNTMDMKPGRYVADLDLTCLTEDTSVRVWFNVTENATDGAS